MIEKAKMPLLLIGAGANRKRTSQALLAFIEKTGIPFFNTQMGKGVVDERHPKFLGTAALSSNDFLHCAINRADLIINIGHDVIEKPPFFMEEGGTKVIHVNFFPAQVDEVYFPQLNVIGDIASSVIHIAKHIHKFDNWDFSYYYQYNRLIFVFVIILIQVMSLNMRHMTEIGLILMTCHFTMGREHLIMIM